MIKSFKDKETQSLFNRSVVPKFRAIDRQALRRLVYLNAATSLKDLQNPPSNRFEK
jgi:proteic killer suppression protein